MSEISETKNKGKGRRTIILKCDLCGKEKGMREVNLYQKEIDAINDNNGCYCSKCLPRDRKGFTVTIFPGEFFYIYPKVIPLKEFEEWQEGVARAKEILRRGLEQSENK